MSRTKILLVEDEEVYKVDIRQHLVHLGYEVVGKVSTGESAICLAGEMQPDLVLMDINLRGEMDAIQAANLIRKNFFLPVIFLNASANEAVFQRAKVTQAFGYVLKPSEEQELSVNIEMALFKHRAEQKLRDSEMRLRTIFESALEGMFMIDSEFRIVDVNPAGYQLFGYTSEEMHAKGFKNLFLPEDLEPILNRHSSTWQEGSSLFEQRMRMKDGSAVWVEMTIAPIKMNGKSYSLASMRDVTQRKQAAVALKESEERYMLAAQGANDGLWDWNLLAEKIYFSSRWKSILGYSDAEISSRPNEWFSRVHPEDLDQLKISLSAHLKGLTKHFECEHRILHKDNTYRWVLCRGMAVRNDQNIVHRLSGSQTDITNRKQAEEQILFDAFHDSLTKLPNRALFIDRLAQVIERSHRREDFAYSVLFLDLDQFKNVNDSLGHDIGDRLLIAIGKMLESCVRSIDTVARLGGDEFVILLEDVESLEDTTLVTDRIQEILQKPIQIGNNNIHTSASIGVVFSHGGYERTEDILRDADIAMYQSKALGKNRSCLFETQMRKQALARLELENDLRCAVDNEEFILYYQPIITLATRQISGFEALVRWRHPKQGLILPGEFIPVAEETGLIRPIGRWVLRHGCKQFHTWQSKIPGLNNLFISINVSGKQLVHLDFMDEVVEVLQETHLEPKNLRLEITESTLVANNDIANENFRRIKELGVQLYIDDFGTGYSSLSSIQRFPVSTIKIDQSFIKEMTGNNEMVQSILRFALDMGLDAIAEGVETEEQLGTLQTMICPYGQGFFLSKPLDSADTENLLVRSSLLLPNNRI
jgi:diguanylate cyclase (GGDEF)-like protein/PAS domain S-box-containing protein